MRQFFLRSILFLVWSIDICIAQTKIDLTELSLEELMNIKVTLASKKVESLSEIAAAMTVITQDDIRRSGATSLPEVLRMVPGIQVAHIDANKWAVSARGFNGKYANKLLVLIDGRSIYSPLFSGVFWEVQNVLLEDIERIEVIRGPGASIWGANAVNGIINVITKHAADTQRGLLVVGGGSWEKGFINSRYGCKIGEDFYYRIYSKYYKRGPFVDLAGNTAADQSRGLQGGFRIDWNISGIHDITVLGNINHVRFGQTFSIPSLDEPYFNEFDAESKFVEGYILGRWKVPFSYQTDMELQLIFDRNEMKDEIGTGNVSNFYADFQHRFQLGRLQEIVWGLGYRYSSDWYKNTFVLTLVPNHRNFQLFSAFIQDEFSFCCNRLTFALGSKFEHNDYTGFEMQPNFRVMWKPDTRNRLWGAVSHAIRTPSRVEYYCQLNTTVILPDDPRNFLSLPFLPSVFGNQDYQSETLLAYELGYRFILSDHFSLDVATFFNRYRNLRSVIIDPEQNIQLSIPLIIPVTPRNDTYGKSYGVELAANWWPFDWWRLYGWYSYLKIKLTNENMMYDIINIQKDHDEANPEHQFQIQSTIELNKRIELFSSIRYTDAIPFMNIGKYFMFDACLSWKLNSYLRLSIVGRNLIDHRHREFQPEFLHVTATQIISRVYGSVVWTF
ncbi:TonB-dependent receptor [bacterium]|nr:TonB-dependent receptor [bacterium]RQV93267.1 MAG: TonB-dependent receptor [bacterium]